MTCAIIGLNGHAGSGKDTIGNFLVNAHGFTRFAYADALKTALLQTNPVIYDRVHLQEIVSEHGMDFAKRVFPEVRRLLQEFGTSMRRVDPAIWLRPLDSLVQSGVHRIVVTDVRFDNEAAQVAGLNGINYVVSRPGFELSGPEAAHASERGIAPEFVDAHIVNDGDMYDLYGQVEELLDYQGLI